jgi:hypothetical protein
LPPRPLLLCADPRLDLPSQRILPEYCDACRLVRRSWRPSTEILAQGDRRSHGEPPSVRHSASDVRQPGNAHQSHFALGGMRTELKLREVSRRGQAAHTGCVPFVGGLHPSNRPTVPGMLLDSSIISTSLMSDQPIRSSAGRREVSSTPRWATSPGQPLPRAPIRAHPPLRRSKMLHHSHGPNANLHGTAQQRRELCRLSATYPEKLFDCREPERA